MEKPPFGRSDEAGEAVKIVSFNQGFTAPYAGSGLGLSKMVPPVRNPMDYGMDRAPRTVEDARECLRLYFQDTPIIAEAQIPHLFSFNLSRYLRSALTKEGFWEPRDHPDYGRIYCDGEWGSGQMHPKHSYGEEGWDPIYGPLTLKTLHEPGDDLLLGRSLVAWGSALPHMRPDLLPSHWLPEQGGWGGGMIVHRSPTGVEEWVLFLMHEYFHAWARLSSMFADLNSMLVARTIALGRTPKLRIILGMKGEHASAGRQDTRRHLYRYQDAYRQGLHLRDSLRGTYQHLGIVQVSFGLASGLWSDDPGCWRICWNPLEEVTSVRPKRPKWKPTPLRDRYSRASTQDRLKGWSHIG